MGVDMVGIVMVCLYCNVWGCVCVCGFCTLWMCEAYVILWVGIWWVLLWCVCIVMCGGVYVWVLYFMDV